MSPTLTASPGVDVRGAVEALRAEIEMQPGEGAVFVGDKGDHGSEHIHGIALVQDPAVLVERWCSLTGADPKYQKIKTVTGWAEHMAGDSHNLRRQIAGVLGYAFKPWPAGYGRRDLDHVIACGTLAAPWRAVLTAARGEGASKPGDGLKPSQGVAEASQGTDRKCPRCRKRIATDKRSDTIYCSDQCRKNASREKKKAAAEISE